MAGLNQLFHHLIDNVSGIVMRKDNFPGHLSCCFYSAIQPWHCPEMLHDVRFVSVEQLAEISGVSVRV